MATEFNIKVTKELKDKLDEIKIHPRETYDDIIQRLLKEAKLHLEKIKEEAESAGKELEEKNR